MVPKLKFIKLDIEENLNSLLFYLNSNNSKNSPLDFYKFVFKLFPELSGKVKENMSDEEIYMLLEEEVKPILEDLSKNSYDDEKYQLIWDNIGDNIMKDLEDKLDIKWSFDDDIICRIGLLPVYSRDILGKSFDINYGNEENHVIATCIHELCHLIYFQKWMKIYPDYTEEEFDSPHIAWYLSEAMIDPLVNNDTFRKYTNDDLTSYTIFYEINIDGRSIIDILRDYVLNYSIEIAIKKGYELFKKYENEIKNFRSDYNK